MTRTTLGELCKAGGGTIQTGPFGSQLHASDYVAEGVAVVMPQNIGENVIVHEGIARIGTADATRLERHRLELGDIVYSRRGDVERRALVREADLGSMCGTGCLLVRVGSAAVTDPTYLSYLLGAEENRSWIVKHAVGATMLNLNTKILSALPLEVAPLSEQRAIAEVLGALDDKIAANRNVATRSRDLAATIVSAVASRVPLADLATASRSTLSPATFGKDPVLHFSLPACDIGVAERVGDPSEIKSAKFELTKPCVLVSKLNPRIPRIWDVPSLPGMKCLSSTEFVVLIPRIGATSVLAAALDDPRFSLALRTKVAGTSGSHQRVKPAELLATEVADIRLLKVADRDSIAALGNLRASLVDENEQLAKTRDGLLPLLMSGRLRVKDAEKQIGEVV